MGHGHNHQPMVTSKVAKEYIGDLHAGGMTFNAISDKSGVSRSRLRAIYHGRDMSRNRAVFRIRQHTQDAILSVDFEESRKFTERNVSPLGMRRRIRAMQADGFPIRLIEELFDISKPTVYHHSHGKYSFVRSSAHRRVAAAYEDVAMKVPADFGVADWQARRSAAFARRNRHAPRHCWDDDTIDDPDALPEWTGRCGTVEGFRIHKRDDIPMCLPCRRARRSQDEVIGERDFSVEKFRAIREKQGVSCFALADLAGVDIRTVENWNNGHCPPSLKHIDKAAIALKHHIDDFYEDD